MMILRRFNDNINFTEFLLDETTSSLLFSSFDLCWDLFDDRMFYTDVLSGMSFTEFVSFFVRFVLFSLSSLRVLLALYSVSRPFRVVVEKKRDGMGLYTRKETVFLDRVFKQKT